MGTKVPVWKSPPVHVYDIGHPLYGCALAIPVVPTNPVTTAPDEATIMAAANKIRNFILAPSIVGPSPEFPPPPTPGAILAYVLFGGKAQVVPKRVWNVPSELGYSA